MSSIAITCRQIQKSFKTKESETYALRNVDLEINAGEFMMLVGPSGCGKTTLISIIAGILKPDSGDCIVEGVNYKEISENDLLDFRAKKIGFVFQSFNLIPTLSIIENVAVPLIINNVVKEEALFQAREMLKVVGLEDKTQSSAAQLSGGEQQRIAIARALVHNPSLLICDEPTSALDRTNGTKILELMKTINQNRKTTFIIVTHDSRIYQYADRIAHMNDGFIVKITE